MGHSILRRILFAGIILTSWGAQPPAARAAQCQSSCGSGHRVCTLQTRTATKACLQGCGSGVTAGACKAGCVRTFRGAQTACRAARADCGTSCPAPLAAVDTCSGTCSSTAPTCFADAFSAGKACVQSCPAGTGLPGCWGQCAAGLRSRGATCLATLQGCLAACQGPVSGACFDTIALQCTTEACSPAQTCSQPNEFCSPRCATPPPGGTCFDPSTMQCTQQPCSASQPCAQANQTCVPECPLPPPKGTCFDTTSKQCTGQPCALGASCGAANLLCTLQCPRPFPTPTPQCSSVPCGGQCVNSPPCPSGSPCPEIASLLGQCAPDSAGTCQCVPPSPGPTRTPQSTPTPQCQGVPCGGSCIVSPCPPGALCPIRLGQCTSDTAGECQCVPIAPPTQPPGPTPPPQCAAVPCGGTCVMSPPCPFGAPCSTGIGQCEMSTTGACECVPVIPTPVATPTPQCTGTCAGPCTIAFPPFPCPPNEVCAGPEVPVLAGQCEMSAAGGCECVPIVPTPAATPTPQCTGGTCVGPCTMALPCAPNLPCPNFVVLGQCESSGTSGCACVPIPPPTQPPLPTATPQCAAVPCGGQCVIVPTCPSGGACPDFVIPGECRDDASGACQCSPSSVPTPTPAPTCATDADCNDDDACTVDHCIDGMCEHACICLTAAGAPACCPGPAALCARPCGTDPSGICGGTCPSGATCETLPTAVGGCGCVSSVGGQCGGFIVGPPVCAEGLVCQQSNPDITGVCVVRKCIPLFASGCAQTSDCCEPCGNGRRPPCGVCIHGTCIGAP